MALGKHSLVPCALGPDSPEEEYEGCRLLDALQHALLGQVVGAVVVPHLEAHALKLQVDGWWRDIHGRHRQEWQGGQLCARGASVPETNR